MKKIFLEPGPVFEMDFIDDGELFCVLFFFCYFSSCFFICSSQFEMYSLVLALDEIVETIASDDVGTDSDVKDSSEMDTISEGLSYSSLFHSAKTVLLHDFLGMANLSAEEEILNESEDDNSSSPARVLKRFWTIYIKVLL